MTIKWTNSSVLAFAEGLDPIKKIQAEAQKLVLRAFENGWEGPPYNPLEIAKLLGVKARPRSDIADARTIEEDGKAAIEFNPSQARERVRFSIAHEVAHLLFEDVLDAPRYRGGAGYIPDEWQLEMLCNIAASEFVMPIGSLDLGSTLPSIERLMVERRTYDVSAEAFMIRMAKSSSLPVMIFCASPIKGNDGKWIYQIDYAIGSPTAPSVALSGLKIPQSSIVYRCTAIGYTDAGHEDWVTGDPLSIECVGIPSYPGASLPRSIGLIRFQENAPGRNPMRFVHGNALEPRGADTRIVCQIVNDRALRWGGGIARQSARKYPHAEQRFGEWLKEIPPVERLGAVHLIEAEKNIYLASLVAQSGFGSSREARIRYAALESALEQTASNALRLDASVHMPRIGTGAAGGEWPTIHEMIEEIFTRSSIQVTVYDLPPKRAQLELF